jgi:F-type H+-transporting ATPase subunit alpha
MVENKIFTKLIKEGRATAEVIALNDFTVKISPLPNAAVYSVVMFSSGAEGVVWQIHQNSMDVLILNDVPIYANELVVLYKDELTIGVGKKLLGRIINPLGKPLDGKGFVATKEEAKYFRPAPGFSMRGNVEDPLESGVTIVDALLPLVKGQRMAVMGDSKSGKTSFLTQTAIHQAQAGTVVVYVLVSKSRNELSRMVETFEKAKVMKNIILVCADSAEPLPVGFLSVYAGCAIGESFWYAGQDVMVIYDDFTNHAKIYREMALLLDQNVGREAYPGDMFHVHAALLERAGKLAENNATMTVLVAGSTPNNDLSDFQSTRLISMSDGQIVFDLNALHDGRRPAVNADLSVSRVGGGLNPYLDHQITSSVVRALGRYKQAKAMTSFIDQVSELSRLEVALGLRISEALQQSSDEYYSFAQQRVLLETILKAEDPSYLDTIWLKGQLKNIKPGKKYTIEELDKMTNQLVKASEGPAK